MKIKFDGQGQPYVQWEQAPGGYKRAWIQRRQGQEKDWAGSGRYINVVRCESLNGSPAGAPTDFPVFDVRLSDSQVLHAFVHAICAVTGCILPDEGQNT